MRMGMAAGQVLRINDGAGPTISPPMLSVIVGLSLLLSLLHLLSALFSSISLSLSRLSMPLWVWRICAHFQINAAIIVYRWNCWHCAQWFTCATLTCLSCNFSTFRCLLEQFPRLSANKRNTYSPCPETQRSVMWDLCLPNEIDEEYLLQYGMDLQIKCENTESGIFLKGF